MLHIKTCLQSAHFRKHEDELTDFLTPTCLLGTLTYSHKNLSKCPNRLIVCNNTIKQFKISGKKSHLQKPHNTLLSVTVSFTYLYQFAFPGFRKCREHVFVLLNGELSIDKIHAHVTDAGFEEVVLGAVLQQAVVHCKHPQLLGSIMTV